MREKRARSLLFRRYCSVGVEGSRAALRKRLSPVRPRHGALSVQELYAYKYILSPSPSGRWQRPSKPPYAGSNPAGDAMGECGRTANAAEMVMRRKVAPWNEGSNPPVPPFIHSQTLVTVIWLFFFEEPHCQAANPGFFDRDIDRYIASG